MRNMPCGRVVPTYFKRQLLTSAGNGSRKSSSPVSVSSLSDSCEASRFQRPPTTQLTLLKPFLPWYLSSFLPQIEKERERTIQCYSQEPHTFCYRSEIKGAIIRLKAKQSKNCRNSVLLSSHALQPLCVCLIYMACSHIGTHRIDYIRGWDLQIYTHINVCVCVCMCIYGASQEAQW